MACPNLSNLSIRDAPCTAVPAVLDMDKPRFLKPGMRLEDVDRDGSCLYHCLIGLRAASSLWMKGNSSAISSVEMLKTSLASYFTANYELFRAHWQKYLSEIYKTDATVEIHERYASEYIMTPGQWGGDLELDIAAHFFNVIIHKFERNTPNVKPGESKLVASFYPNAELSDRGRTITKWVVVLNGGHFNYAFPDVPRSGLVALPSPSSSPAEPRSPPSTPQTPPTRPFTPLRPRKPTQNEKQRHEEQRRLLSEAARAREARETRQEGERSGRGEGVRRGEDGGACARRPIDGLTAEEERQIAALEELSDEEMARRMQAEEDRRYQQSEADREMARQLQWAM